MNSLKGNRTAGAAGGGVNGGEGVVGLGLGSGGSKAKNREHGHGTDGTDDSDCCAYPMKELTAVQMNNVTREKDPLNPNTAKPVAAAGGAGAVSNTAISVLVWQRLSVLVTLLLLQSASQFILENYEALIQNNVVLPLFLTMLVGAGGNAGNQAAVHSITGLVTGEYRLSSCFSVLRREMVVGAICASVLFVIGYMRVYYFYTTEDSIQTGMFETVFSIAFSLFLIVITSVVMGAVLPFILLKVGLNVEHAAPVIQVVMDIVGVLISCVVCSTFLPAGTGGGTANNLSPPTTTTVGKMG